MKINLIENFPCDPKIFLLFGSPKNDSYVCECKHLFNFISRFKILISPLRTRFIIISSSSSRTTSHRQLEQSALRQLHFNESHLEFFGINSSIKFHLVSFNRLRRNFCTQSEAFLNFFSSDCCS